MINEPVRVVGDGFQDVWLDVVKQLMASRWELRNLIVHIKNSTAMDLSFQSKVRVFAKAQGLLSPKQVAYTIFPHGLYQNGVDVSALCSVYNKPRGFYERLRRLEGGGWGNYFRRMTNYEGTDGTINQLQNIVSAIQSRDNLSSAAYTIVIQKPGGETIRPLGGPCLNYIAVQAEPGPAGQPFTLGLLAVYRNHDFLKRAYGNYWGLCNLLMFLAAEVKGTPGPLTCVSSHAYVDSNKTALKKLVERL